jgi:hypothetical protein
VSAFSFAIVRSTTTPSIPSFSKIARARSLSRIWACGTSVYAGMPTAPCAVISRAAWSSAA